jgi:hypothetical protein
LLWNVTSSSGADALGADALGNAASGGAAGAAGHRLATSTIADMTRAANPRHELRVMTVSGAISGASGQIACSASPNIAAT